MPYKERLKHGQARKKPKPTYSVTNWHEYNKSLKNRGKISLYFPEGDLKNQFINENSYTAGVSGRSVVFKDAYIKLIFVFYRLYNLGLRQITGFMEDYFSALNIDIEVPSFGHLSDRFAELEPEIQQRCERLAKRLAKSHGVTLIVDSTGMKFGRAFQWYEKKYGLKARKTPWRKMHLSMDTDMNVHGVAVTSTEVSDPEGLKEIIPSDIPIEQLTGDGAYYSAERVESLCEQGIIPSIPPPSHAVDHGTESVHDQMVSYIQEKGRFAFQEKFNYGIRSLVESQFSRIKRCIGERLLTQREQSQHNEGIMIGNIINFWNSLGRPVCVKNG
jgi:Transposase DDE domain